MDINPATGEVYDSPIGMDIVPLDIGSLDPDVLAQWTPTPEQVFAALSIARAKNITAPKAIDKYRRALNDAERELKIALGLAVMNLRAEFGSRTTLTELQNLAYGADDRVKAAAESRDTAWLELEYAKDFAEAVARDVTLIQSIAKALNANHP